MAKPNHEQGEGGVHRTRKTTSHLDQAPGASSQGPKISQKGGKIPFNSDGQDNKSTGDHLRPHKPTQNRPSAVRGGGTIIGHDHVNPNAGKAKSGSKDKVAKELSGGGKQAPADLPYLKK